MSVKGLWNSLAAGCLAFAAIALVPGCDRKEKVIDVETPRTDVEVERNKETGEVDVEVERKNNDE